MGYDWDLFFSYPRRDPVGPWVRHHLFPGLQKWLNAALREQPRLFLDEKMEDGVHWPTHLSDALHRSKCMLAVWAPPYFGSAWCLAEWHSMRERQRLLGVGQGNVPGLIMPVRFFDGASFPQGAKETQSSHDYCRFNSFPSFPPGRATLRSKAYRDFDTELQKLAEILQGWILGAPPWSPHWPLLRPPPPDGTAPLRFSQVGLR